MLGESDATTFPGAGSTTLFAAVWSTARMNPRTPFLALVAAAALLLTGCSAATTPSDTTATASAAASHPLIDGLDAVAIVDTLEALPLDERPDDLMVSVRPGALIVTDAGGEREQPLPDDLFYLSVAPYTATTHECFFHSLTTCRGELGGAPIDVRVVTDAGDTLVDETRTAADNGFVGLWLPRGVAGTITLTVDGATTTSAFATGADDPTCVTTMQLV